MSKQRLDEIQKEMQIISDKIKVKSQTFFDTIKSYEEYQEYTYSEHQELYKLGREYRMLQIPNFKDLSIYGVVMPLITFIEEVKQGNFIDYDGYGYYVKNNQMSDILIHPSDIEFDSVRKDFDQIIWFNR